MGWTYRCSTVLYLVLSTVLVSKFSHLNIHILVMCYVFPRQTHALVHNTHCIQLFSCYVLVTIVGTGEIAPCGVYPQEHEGWNHHLLR